MAATDHTVGGGWEPVVWPEDGDSRGYCPVCDIDYAECPCPGPAQLGFEYKIIGGHLHARPCIVGMLE